LGYGQIGEVFVALPNRKQKAVLLIGLALFLLAGLFPPTVEGWGKLEEYNDKCGPVAILVPYDHYTYYVSGHLVTDERHCHTSYPTLAILWTMIVVSTAVFLVLFRTQKEGRAGDEMEGEH
jgi:hypothetical protein